MSSSVSAIGVAPIQPVPPIVYQPPEEGIAPVDASAASADDSSSGGPDVLYQRGPQWPAEPLTYANAAPSGAPEAGEPQPSDAIFEPGAGESWATEAAQVIAEEAPLEAAHDAPEPLQTSEPLDEPVALDLQSEDRLPEEAPAAQLQGGFEIDEAPEWLAENGAAPAPDTPDALDGNVLLAQELLDQVLSNEALYPSETPVEDPAPEPVDLALPTDELAPAFATPANDAEWLPDQGDLLGTDAMDQTDAAPATSDEAILAATDNGGTAPIAVPDRSEAPAAPAEAAAISVEKRSYDPFTQATFATATGGAGAQAAAMAQAAYEMVARVSNDSPTALDAVKLA